MLYPVVGVVGFCNEEGVAGVEWMLVTWVQSGGARCVPLPERAMEPD